MHVRVHICNERFLESFKVHYVTCLHKVDWSIDGISYCNNLQTFLCIAYLQYVFVCRCFNSFLIQQDDRLLSVYTHVASMYTNLLEQKKAFAKKIVQLPEDWFWTLTRPPFRWFGTPTCPPWRHVKTLYIRFTLQKRRFLIFWPRNISAKLMGTDCNYHKSSIKPPRALIFFKHLWGGRGALIERRGLIWFSETHHL